MVGEGRRGNLMVDFEAESEEHSEEAEGFGVGVMVRTPVLYVRKDGKRKTDERKVMKAVWWSGNEQGEKQVR